MSFIRTSSADSYIHDYQVIQDLFISQSDRTDLQAQIGTDSQEYDITEDNLH